MMRISLSVFAKEILDNFRDRRTLASALLMGPLFGPMLFAFVINLSIERSLSAADDTLDLPVIGQQHAPNLMRYLESNNIKVVDGPANRDEAIATVKAGTLDVVVLIPESFGEQLRGGLPARVEVFADHANSQAERDARRARRAISGYRRLNAERPVRDIAWHDELLFYLRHVDGRHVPCHRHDGGRARTRFAGASARTARHEGSAHARQNSGHVCLHGLVAHA